MPGLINQTPETTDASFYMPQHSKEPYDYAFVYGETAWALQATGIWQRVLVISEGHWQKQTKCAADHKLYRFWYCKYPTGKEDEVKRHVYAPMLGELKPDYPFVRRLLHEEKVLSQQDMADVALEIAHCGC